MHQVTLFRLSFDYVLIAEINHFNKCVYQFSLKAKSLQQL